MIKKCTWVSMLCFYYGLMTRHVSLINEHLTWLFSKKCSGVRIKGITWITKKSTWWPNTSSGANICPEHLRRHEIKPLFACHDSNIKRGTLAKSITYNLNILMKFSLHVEFLCVSLKILLEHWSILASIR